MQGVLVFSNSNTVIFKLLILGKYFTHGLQQDLHSHREILNGCHDFLRCIPTGSLPHAIQKVYLGVGYVC